VGRAWLAVATGVSPWELKRQLMVGIEVFRDQIMELHLEWSLCSTADVGGVLGGQAVYNETRESVTEVPPVEYDSTYKE